MAFIDNRGRLFGWMNLVDLLVVLVLIALVAFAYVRFVAGTGDEETLITTFRVEQVREPTILEIEVGDEVRDETGTVLGTVRQTEDYPTKVEFLNEQTGEPVVVESNLYFDIDFAVEGQGQVSQSQYAIGSIPLEVGRQLVVKGPGFSVRAAIIDIEVAGAS